MQWAFRPTIRSPGGCQWLDAAEGLILSAFLLLPPKTWGKLSVICCSCSLGRLLFLPHGYRWGLQVVDELRGAAWPSRVPGKPGSVLCVRGTVVPGLSVGLAARVGQGWSSPRCLSAEEPHRRESVLRGPCHGRRPPWRPAGGQLPAGTSAGFSTIPTALF